MKSFPLPISFKLGMFAMAAPASGGKSVDRLARKGLYFPGQSVYSCQAGYRREGMGNPARTVPSLAVTRENRSVLV